MSIGFVLRHWLLLWLKWKEKNNLKMIGGGVITFDFRLR